MEEKAKKKSIINKTTVGIVLCLIGSILFILGKIDSLSYNNNLKDINEVALKDIKSGMIIEGDITHNLGIYAGREGIKYDYKYYIIPINKNSYISFHSRFNEVDSLLDKQFAEYLKYLEGGNIPQTVVHIKGKVKKLTDSDEIKYLDSYLKDTAYKDSYTNYYYLDEFDEKVSSLVEKIGRVIFFIGLFLILYGLEKKSKMKNDFGIPINK